LRQVPSKAPLFVLPIPSSPRKERFIRRHCARRTRRRKVSSALARQAPRHHCQIMFRLARSSAFLSRAC
jgi:hypothetical protein